MEIKVTTVEVVNQTVVSEKETSVQTVEITDKSVVTEEVKVVEVVSIAEQGPTGAQGEKGDTGVGIQDFDSDPLLIYMLARG